MDEKRQVSNGVNKKIPTFLAISLIVVLAVFVGLFSWLKCQEVPNPAYKSEELRKINSDGENFSQGTPGYVKSIYEKNGKKYLTFDPIEFLEGKEALKAKIKKGECMKSIKNKQALIQEIDDSRQPENSGKFLECVPYDYYILNPDKKLETLEISPNVSIKRTTVFIEGDPGGYKSMSFEELKSGFSGERFHFKSLPFDLEMKGGLVVGMRQVYLP